MSLARSLETLFAGLLQERDGYAKNEAEKELDDFAEEVKL